MGVHHTGTQDLDPAGILTGTAALTAAQHTGNIHLYTGLGKREEAGTQANLTILTKHLTHKIQQCAFQIGQ